MQHSHVVTREDQVRVPVCGVFRPEWLCGADTASFAMSGDVSGIGYNEYLHIYSRV